MLGPIPSRRSGLAFLAVLATACSSSTGTAPADGGADAATPDGRTSPRHDAGRDAGARDATAHDATVRDSGAAPDATARDSGREDALAADAAGRDGETGPKETGPRETGPRETGPKDAGPNDTGAGDVAASDTGAPDGGHDARDSGADSGAPQYPFDVLTQRGNNARTGIYASETVLTRANVNASSFGKLFSVSVDGDVYAQPLYVSSYLVNGAIHNVLIAATEHNSVFAFDADTGGAPLWKQTLGESIFHNLIPTNDIQTEIGITSTPVIDRAQGLLYVVNKDATGDAGAATPVMTHRMHVLDLATGNEMPGSPFVLVPSVPGTVDDAATLYFDPKTQLARPGLTLLNGLVYVAWGSHSDINPYHGFLVAYQYSAAGASLVQEYAWSTTQDGHQGSLWQAGQGPMVDSQNNLYVMVANGTSSVQEGGTSYAEAFVKLSPTLTVEDWFLDSNYEELTENDFDVGSGGPIMVPGTNLIVGAGKQGIMYVLNRTNLGHITPASDENSQIVQSFDVGKASFGSPLLWDGEGATRLYLWGPEEPLFAYTLTDAGVFNTASPLTTGDAAVTPSIGGLSPSIAALALSTNGGLPGTGILWAGKPDGNISHFRAPGALYALDPTTLDILWTSGNNFPDGGTTPLGTCAKFVAPTVANGKVYIPGSTSTTNDRDARTDPGVEISVFGLLPDAG